MASYLFIMLRDIFLQYLVCLPVILPVIFFREKKRVSPGKVPGEGIASNKNSKGKSSPGKLAGEQLMIFLILGILSVTGGGTLASVLMHSDPALTFTVNLEFFKWGGIHEISFLLNGFLFLPFGILLPVVWKRERRGYRTVLFGFFLSLFIELSQLLNYRVTDVDDLLMNTVGTLAGYLLLRGFVFFLPWEFPYDSKGESPLPLFLLVLALRFFLLGFLPL